MRVLRVDPMLLLTIVVGLGVLLTMKLTTVNNGIVSSEVKAQQLKYNTYVAPSTHVVWKKDSDQSRVSAQR